MRRHLMKVAGAVALPAWFTEHIVCWYSPKRQGATNESLSENPVLKDLSGHGRHMPLQGFLWTETSGIDADKALSMGNGTEHSYSEWTYNLNDGFVFIAKQIAIENVGSTLNTWEFNNCIGTNNWSEAIFIGAQTDKDRQVCSYGKWTNGLYQGLPTDSAVVDAFGSKAFRFYRNDGTIDKYTNRGGNADTTKHLMMCTDRATGTACGFKVKLYDAFLFNCDLTTEQIDWVKTNLIDN